MLVIRKMMEISPWCAPRHRPTAHWKKAAYETVTLSFSDALTQVWHQTSNWFSEWQWYWREVPTSAIEHSTLRTGADTAFHVVHSRWTLWRAYIFNCCSIQLSLLSKTAQHKLYWSSMQSPDTNVLNRHSMSAFWQQISQKVNYQKYTWRSTTWNVTSPNHLTWWLILDQNDMSERQNMECSLYSGAAFVTAQFHPQSLHTVWKFMVCFTSLWKQRWAMNN